MADDTYDVFVSYSRADGRHAAEIDSVLRDKGLKTFFDRRNLAAGLPWVRALEQAIGAAKAVIVLIGPRGLGNTQQYERELAFVRQTRDPAFPIVPVILPETTTDPPFDFLRVLTWIDFSQVTRVLDAPDVLQRLLTAIHGGVTEAEATREAICPYRGLDAFREEDSAFFFGRGSANDPNSPIGELVNKVREHPFVIVVGRSGSGKSSLVYAGLLPALRHERDRFWTILSFRPADKPLQAIAELFNPKAADEGAAAYAMKINDETEALRNGRHDLLASMIQQYLQRAEGKPDRMLLYIDQWEELYAQAPPSSDKERTAQHTADVNRFINLLLTASRTAPVAIVATVRADFYDPLIGHEEIKALLPTRQVLLGKMLRSELESTIVEPARKVGLTFDPPKLVQRILDEAGEDEGMLPLLQYALKESWALRKGNTITGDSYARSGGVREAIRITAERTFEALSAEDQQAARQLFLRLVTPGEGREDTRARAAMPSEPIQRKIVEQFASPRTRLLVTGSDRAARPTVEVAHEALIQTWTRLRAWVDANREKLRARTAVLQAKAEWEQEGRREDLLLPAGFQLARARALLAEPGDLAIDDIQEFITRSSIREEAEHKKRRRRRLTSFLAGAFLFLAPSILLGGYIGLEWYSGVYIPAHGAKLLDDARSSYTTAEERRQNMEWLAQHAQPFNFSRSFLRDFDLKELAIPQANFRQAILENVDFTGAGLLSANFAGARLEKIKFTQANLNGSVFDQARLCNVDFSRADLTDASFLDVAYDEQAPPNFKDTAWWLSIGWNLQQVDLFRKQQGGHDPIVPDNRRTLSQVIPTYHEAIQKFGGSLKSNPNDTLKRAVALDGMAWYRAIWGLELADAEKSAQEAFNIIHALRPGADILTKSYMNDTVGYILLQRGRTQDARKLLEIATQAENPGATFRYALALHILGQDNEAERNLKKAMRDGDYWPSHELLLLRSYFNGSDGFLKTFANLTERPQALTRRACWTTQN